MNVKLADIILQTVLSANMLLPEMLYTWRKKKGGEQPMKGQISYFMHAGHIRRNFCTTYNVVMVIS